MLPGGIITGKDTPESEFVVESRETKDGEIPDRALNANSVAIAGIALLLIAVALLIISVSASGGGLPFVNGPSEVVEQVTFILGVVALVAAIACLIAWGRFTANEAQRALIIEGSRDDEPVRDYGFSSVAYREVVKVRCRYCGTLNDVTRKTCVACGATL